MSLPLQYMVSTWTLVALLLGEKQSSPMSTQARSTLRFSTFRESKKSVFLGRAVALVERAVQMTSLNEMSLARRISVHDHQDLARVPYR